MQRYSPLENQLLNYRLPSRRILGRKHGSLYKTTNGIPVGIQRKYPRYPIVSGAKILVSNILEEPEQRPLIDIGPGRTETIRREEGWVTLGAGASVETFKNVLVPLYPASKEYLLSFASLPVRNRATIGGSLAGASAVGDIMPLLLALNAQLKLRTSGGSRTVACKGFNTGYHTHLLAPDEIIYAVRIPIPSKTRKLFAHKQSRRKDMDISTLTFCLCFDVVNGIVCNASSGFGGMAPTPSVQRNWKTLNAGLSRKKRSPGPRPSCRNSFHHKRRERLCRLQNEGSFPFAGKLFLETHGRNHDR